MDSCSNRANKAERIEFKDMRGQWLAEDCRFPIRLKYVLNQNDLAHGHTKEPTDGCGHSHG